MALISVILQKYTGRPLLSYIHIFNYFFKRFILNLWIRRSLQNMILKTVKDVKRKAEYIDRTNQRSETRIHQQVPTMIRHGRCDNLHKLVNTLVSAIAEYLLNNQVCAMSITSDFFIIISRAHPDYHMKILVTLYIRSREPLLRN